MSMPRSHVSAAAKNIAPIPARTIRTKTLNSVLTKVERLSIRLSLKRSSDHIA